MGSLVPALTCCYGAGLCPPKRHPEALFPMLPEECDLLWKHSLCRCSLLRRGHTARGWAFHPAGWHPYKKREEGSVESDTQGEPHGDEGRDWRREKLGWCVQGMTDWPATTRRWKKQGSVLPGVSEGTRPASYIDNLTFFIRSSYRHALRILHF